jgi:hypothetical protein
VKPLIIYKQAWRVTLLLTKRDGALEQIVPESRGVYLLRNIGESSTSKMLDIADVPSFLRLSKDLSAKAQGVDPEAFGWGDWFKSASDEQILTSLNGIQNS